MQIARRRRPMQGVVPTATMADIAFLLIIFFMITTAFTLDRTPLDLPETREQDQAAQDAAVIVITPDDRFLFTAGEVDSQPVAGLEELSERIGAVTAVNMLHPFSVKADRLVRYRTIDAVLEVLRANGAQNVTLLSRGAADQ
jgi:biopolymer transport protein ExbD